MTTDKLEICPNCGANALFGESHAISFKFRSGGRDYDVVADTPMSTCKACGDSFVGFSGEIAQHNAICRAMGRMAPGEIKSLRATLGLSRKDFSKLTGIGSASLARWESGELIQTESSDNLLRLVAVDHNARALAAVRGVTLPGAVPAAGRGRAADAAMATAVQMRAARPSSDSNVLQRFPALTGVGPGQQSKIMAGRERFQIAAQ